MPPPHLFPQMERRRDGETDRMTGEQNDRRKNGQTDRRTLSGQADRRTQLTGLMAVSGRLI